MLSACEGRHPGLWGYFSFVSRNASPEVMSFPPCGWEKACVVAKHGIEGLAQSIHNHGLLNNLAVQPGGEKETFSVLAGGRRLAALNHLAKAKLIPADWGVPCNVDRDRRRHSERGDQPC